MGDISIRIGQFGLWQARIVSILGLCGIFNGLQKLSLTFTLKETDFWCSSSSAELKMEVQPKNFPKLINCDMVEHGAIIPCSRWDYDRTAYPETAISQFNLVCENQHWVALSQTVYLSGYVVGAFASGIFSDKFGRRPAILLSAVSYLVCSLFVAFSPSIVIFNILRWLSAVSVLSLYTASFTYCMEIVGGKWVTIVSVLFGICPSLGFISATLISSVFPRWTDFQLAITLPIIFLLLPLSVPGFLKDSPRWLVANEFLEEAEYVVKKAAEMNSIPYKENLESENTTNGSTASLKDLILTPAPHWFLPTYSLCFSARTMESS